MKNITSVFILLFMVSALTLPVFPQSMEEDCCCGDGCQCDFTAPVACEMEVTECEALLILPIPSAPLNKVNIDQPGFEDLQVTPTGVIAVYQNLDYSEVQDCTSDPPPTFTLPLLI